MQIFVIITVDSNGTVKIKRLKFKFKINTYLLRPTLFERNPLINRKISGSILAGNIL